MQQIQLRPLAELLGKGGHHPAGVLAGFDRHVRQIGDLQRVLYRAPGKSQKTGEQVERQSVVAKRLAHLFQKLIA